MKRCKSCGACQECGALPAQPYPVPYPVPQPYPVYPRPYPWGIGTNPWWGTQPTYVSAQTSGVTPQSISASSAGAQQH